jgi:membrane protein implicated in regulation of membrane protease activity
MAANGLSSMVRRFDSRRSEMFLITLGTMLVVFAIVAVVLYSLVRPWTHTHYQHPSEKLWRPLD